MSHGYDIIINYYIMRVSVYYYTVERFIIKRFRRDQFYLINLFNISVRKIQIYS